MRTHISLPEDLVAEIDALVGARKRSAFIEEAVRNRMRLEKQRQAFEYVASLPPLEIPEDEKNLGWASMDGVEWQRYIRAQDAAIEERKRRESSGGYRIADA